jgi:hypothetical protein
MTLDLTKAECWALRGELLVRLPLRRNDDTTPPPPAAVVDEDAAAFAPAPPEGSIENDLAKFDSIFFASFAAASGKGAWCSPSSIRRRTLRDGSTHHSSSEGGAMTFVSERVEDSLSKIELVAILTEVFAHCTLVLMTTHTFEVENMTDVIAPNAYPSSNSSH